MSIVVDSNINFVNRNIEFSVSGDVTNIDKCYWFPYAKNANDFGQPLDDDSSTVNVVYDKEGIYYPILRVKHIDGTYTVYTSDTPVKINPLPRISLNGTTIANYEISVVDLSKQSYQSGTIDFWSWNFNDGSDVVYEEVSDSGIQYHTYISAGLYNLTVNVVDLDGNIATDVLEISVLGDGTYCELKTDLITLDGPEENRYGKNKEIDLVTFLPQRLRNTETEEFLKIFEDFLNEMFDGLDGYINSEEDISINSSIVSDSKFEAPIQEKTYDIDSTQIDTEASDVDKIEIQSSVEEDNKKISILEKIKRLTELQDPDLIDLDYIQFFAKNLGYNININRGEVIGDHFGNVGSVEDMSTVDERKYLRFVVKNLPNWYKIKTTKNAIKVMLYSFGLVGDLVEMYTKDYDMNYNNWIMVNDNLNNVDDSWYPTPHFSLLIDLDSSLDIAFDIKRKEKIINAIDSIRPINTVFRRLSGKLSRHQNIIVRGKTRFGQMKYVGYGSSVRSSDYFFHSET